MMAMTYDSHRRRLWIAGQRCHHGATGALLTGTAAATLLATRAHATRLAALVAAGGLLMAHDWHDRALWFQPGHQHQP
jgi:hypothetical protein